MSADGGDVLDSDVPDDAQEDEDEDAMVDDNGEDHRDGSGPCVREWM